MKAVWSAIPVRADIANLPVPAERFQGREGRLKILVVGGSLGADVLNKTVPQALALLPDNARPQMYHQSGRGKLGSLQADYDALGVKAECVEFITDIGVRLPQCRFGDLPCRRADDCRVDCGRVGRIVSAVSSRR